MASVQDRGVARPLLMRLRQLRHRTTLLWAGGGYVGKLVTWAKDRTALTLESRNAVTTLRASSFCPAGGWSSAPCSWICRTRRCVRDYERLPEHHEAMVKWSMIILLGRRLAR